MINPLLGRIESSYFVAGIEVENNLVINSAPIIKYMIGWHVDRVWEYCLRKNWNLERIS